jgi:hypothetical protein
MIISIQEQESLINLQDTDMENTQQCVHGVLPNPKYVGIATSQTIAAPEQETTTATAMIRATAADRSLNFLV